MSRIGKQPIPLPDKVKAAVSGLHVRVEGPRGRLDLVLDPCVSVSVEENAIRCALRPDNEHADAPARFGLVRSLIANMVKGVSEGFTRELEVVGVGYRAAVKGNALELSLGYSHPVLFEIPEGITVGVEKQTLIKITGADRQLVGQTAAQIRKFRLPEPYKGKGVRYAREVVRRKAGKAAAGAAGAAGGGA